MALPLPNALHERVATSTSTAASTSSPYFRITAACIADAAAAGSLLAWGALSISLSPSVSLCVRLSQSADFVLLELLPGAWAIAAKLAVLSWPHTRFVCFGVESRNLKRFAH